MITSENIAISDVSWLRRSYAENCKGKVGVLYEPESLKELVELCTKLYKDHLSFDVIGCTSNIYFRPDYRTDIIVSTRRVNKWEEQESEIFCECGALVSSLSKKMISLGYAGFEGLIDLPGTIGASIYGNASCYKCSICALLISVDVLLPSGEIVSMPVESLKLKHRSTIFKTKEQVGVILSAKLMKKKSDAVELLSLAESNHLHRKTHQIGPGDNLGSIFAVGGPKFKLKIVSAMGFLYSKVLSLFNVKHVREKRMYMQLLILGKPELAPYVYEWNRYVWKDEKAHELFDSYVSLYLRLFSGARIEIEIKENK